MAAHDDETEASTGESTENVRFRPPRRRRRPLLLVGAATVAVVVYLIYLMARGPDAGRAAQGIVQDTLAALPESPLAADDIRAAAEGLRRALEMHPTSEPAHAALGLLQDRVAGQVETDTLEGDLERADAVLAEAGTRWPGERAFADDGTLRARLDEALERRRLLSEPAELLAAAEDRLARDPTGADAIREALDMLRGALELDPDNARARALREDVRRDVLTATREALRAGETGEAGRLLEAAGAHWRDDSELARLRGEIERQVGERARALEMQRLLELAERRLAADRLMTPAGDNAVTHFRAVLGVDPENPQARRGLERIADRYGVLVRDAIDDGALRRADRLLGNLAAVAPRHADLERLRERVEMARQAANATAAPAAASPGTTVTAAANAPELPAEEVPTDPEGRLWFEVRTSCVDAELRRYIEAYPAGRYIEDAWRRISSCIEAR